MIAMIVCMICEIYVDRRSDHICKYADDSSLLVPEKCDVYISKELQNVHKWADENKLKINLAKTKELVFKKAKCHELFCSFRATWPRANSMCEAFMCMAAI